MANKGEGVKLVAVFDFALGILSIVYETLAIALGEKRVYQVEPSDMNQNDRYSIPNETDTTNRNYDTTRLLSYLLIVAIIYGLYLMQMFMASKLFLGTKLMLEEPISSLQKFTCWRLWSFMYLCLLLFFLILTLGYNAMVLTWSHYILVGFLCCHILFRIPSILYVGICRQKLKSGLASPCLIGPIDPPKAGKSSSVSIIVDS